MNREATPAEVEAAVAALAAGAVVGLPTETVYGLAADAANAAAIAAIYRIKGRPTDHPLIVHVLDAQAARRWARWSDAAERLAVAFWPGPLTIVLERHADAPAWACAGYPTIAVRAPSHPVARRVLARLAEVGITGLAAPSANRFGRVSPTTAAHVRADLGDDVAVVLDGGPAEVGIESTIVDLSRGRPVLLRPGHIGAAALSRVLEEPVLPADAEAPRVPGALPSHYAPATPLELAPAQELHARIAAAQAAGKRVAVWSTRPVEAEDRRQVTWLARPDSPTATEQALYDTLRRLDAEGADLILVEAPPATDLWEAIRDRLVRAAAQDPGLAAPGPSGGDRLRRGRAAPRPR